MAKQKAIVVPPIDSSVQREMMNLINSGFEHRTEVESKKPDGLLPMVKPQTRPKEKTGKRQDPDYRPYSTYLLKCLDQRIKIVAARLDVDAADVVNQAIFEFLEGFEEGLNAQTHTQTR